TEAVAARVPPQRRDPLMEPQPEPPLHPDLDLYVEERAPRGGWGAPRKRRGAGTWIGGAAIVAAIGIAAAYVVSEPTRERADEWLSVARTIGDNLWRDAAAIVATVGGAGDARDTGDTRRSADAPAIPPPRSDGGPSAEGDGVDTRPDPRTAAGVAAGERNAADGAERNAADTDEREAVEAAGRSGPDPGAGPSIPPAPPASSASSVSAREPSARVSTPAAESPAEALSNTTSPPRAAEPERIEAVSPTVTIRERQGVAAVQLRRVGGTLAESSFVWSTIDGTATEADDYASFGARVETFEEGAETHTIFVPIVVHSRPEGRESFVVIVSRTDGRDAAAPPLEIEVVIEDD